MLRVEDYESNMCIAREEFDAYYDKYIFEWISNALGMIYIRHKNKIIKAEEYINGEGG